MNTMNDDTASNINPVKTHVHTSHCVITRREAIASPSIGLTLGAF